MSRSEQVSFSSVKLLRTDEELQEMRKEWMAKFDIAFPAFNFDQFCGISDYKCAIRKALDLSDPKVAHRKITKWEGLEEFSEMIEEWKERFNEPLPKFSFTEYGNGVRYREKIKEALDAGDPQKAHIE